MATLAEIRAEAYTVLNEDEETGGSYPSATMDSFINQEQERILREFRMSFSIKRAYFDTSIDSTLANDVAVGATTIDLVDASSWASTGTLWVRGDVIKYTGITANQLTGVTQVSASASSAEEALQVYTLPTDWDEGLQLTEYGTGSKTPTTIRYFDGREGIQSLSGQWTTDFDDDGTEFLIWDNPSTSKRRVMKYYAIPATMTASQDSIIPDPWAIKILPIAAAGRFLITRDEETKGQFLMDKADQFATQMQIALTQREQKFRRKIQPAPRHRGLNLKVGGGNLRHITRLDLTSDT